MITENNVVSLIGDEIEPGEGIDRYISRAAVRSRGWTDTLISEILGECDVEADNPHNRLTRMQLYRLDRVEAAEQDERWVAYQCKRTRPRRLPETMHVYTASGRLIDRGESDW